MTPPSHPSIDRLDERSKAHADKLDMLDERLKKVEGKLDSIISTLSEAKGGWRMLMIVGGMAGVVGAFLTKIASWLPLGIR